jgi:uncharacterized metal-binding protein
MIRRIPPRKKKGMDAVVGVEGDAREHARSMIPANQQEEAFLTRHSFDTDGCTVDVEAEKKTVIFACSGPSKQGGFTRAAVLDLERRGRGTLCSVAGIGGRVPSILRKAHSAHEVVVLDGCSLGCGYLTLKEAGILVHKYVLATDLEVLSENEEYDQGDFERLAWALDFGIYIRKDGTIQEERIDRIDEKDDHET